MMKFLEILQYDSNTPLLFNSSFFLILFILFFGIYILSKNSYYFRILYVSIFSLYFYYKCSGYYFLLLIFSSIVDYHLAAKIHQTENTSTRKRLLFYSVFINLGVLFYFKYTNFFIENINFFTKENLKTFDIFLPIGISFYTFQTMSYTIDVYRKKLTPTKRFVEFLFFVSFFPQLVAGPIVRASQFIPQIARKPKISTYQLDKALLLIMGGLIKKVIISDYISVNFVDRVFDNPSSFSSIENLLATYGYTIQIYCDFSGYSDMAIGLALLMGFRLPPNFRLPYQSKSVTEFWRRWHISLSFWLRDYLYISLGGNRKGTLRTYSNLFLVMLLGGLWHGAAWRFVLWGILHGLALVIERLLKNSVQIPKNKVSKLITWFLTLHFVIFCWIFFRASDYDTAIVVITKISTVFTDNVAFIPIIQAYKNVLIIIASAFTIHLLPKSYFLYGYKVFKQIPLVLKILVLGIVFWLTYLFINSEAQPFIYFQF